MRRAFLLFALLGCLYVPCFAGNVDDDFARKFNQAVEDDVNSTQRQEYMQTLDRFKRQKENYYAVNTPEMVRAEIARRQQQKRTHDLVVATVVAASFLLLVGLGVLTEKLLKKYRVLSRVRLSAKKRHGSHTLDDVFEIEKRG